MNDMPEFVKARGEIEATAKQYENDLKAMQEELQRKASEYDKTKSTMNATKQKETEESLMQLNEKIRTAYQDNSQALQKAQQEKNAAHHSEVSQSNSGSVERQATMFISWMSPLAFPTLARR